MTNSPCETCLREKGCGCVLDGNRKCVKFSKWFSAAWGEIRLVAVMKGAKIDEP